MEKEKYSYDATEEIIKDNLKSIKIYLGMIFGLLIVFLIMVLL